MRRFDVAVMDGSVARSFAGAYAAARSRL